MAPMTLSWEDRGLTLASGGKLISKENDCTGDEIEIGTVSSVSGSDSSDSLRGGDKSTFLAARRGLRFEDLALEGLLGYFLSETAGEAFVLLRLCFDDRAVGLLVFCLPSETSDKALALLR
jgi:hypothetical protein